MNLKSEIMRLWAPPKRLSLSEWADTYAVLSAESSAEMGRWKTLPYQKGIMDAFTDPTVERITCMKSARVGWALALDTPIPTLDGWKKMGELEIGDTLFDENGQQCKITYTSPIFLDRECYEVEFCDGTIVTADANHRWYVEADNTFEYLRREVRSGRTGRPKPGETATKSGVVNTVDMFKMQRTPSGRTALAIPVAKALQIAPVDLLVPPYTLGLWLGDGCQCTPRITQHRDDVETADFIRAEGISVSISYTDARKPNNSSFFLDTVEGKASYSPWASKFRAIGVINNKHIPQEYLRSSARQRLELLRGLMDSDGCAPGKRNGFCEFTNTNINLAAGVYELVASLGMKASLDYRKPQQSHWKQQWRVVFKPTSDCNPFHLQRKAARVQAVSKPSITKRRRIVRVEKVDSVPTRCIEVDSPSHLFLCSRAMIPTHNTKCLNHAIGYFAHQDPCPIMLVQPTVEDAEGYSKEEIAPMIRDTPVLRNLFSEVKAKDGSNTILSKQFPGGTLGLVGANSARGFRRVSRRVVLFDETDGYPASTAEGDQIKLGIRRSEYFWNRKIADGSTPTIKDFSRIEREFLKTDQRRFFVPCPECGEMQYLKWEQMKWEDDDPSTARYQCEHCEALIPHGKKRWMVERGEWRATAESRNRKHIGFHIWAAYSYSPNASWENLVEEFIECRENPEALKTFVNTVLGLPYEDDYASKVSADGLLGRKEPYLDELDDGVLLLTAGVDVQGGGGAAGERLAVSIWGWGVGEEAWLVHHTEIHGDPTGQEVWQQLSKLLSATWRRVDGVEIGIEQVCVDSGGHATAEVYRYARENVARIAAIKGSSRPAQMPIGKGSAVDFNYKGKSIKKGALVYLLGTDTIKTTLFGRLKGISEHGPGYIHFGAAANMEYFEQLTAEKQILKKGSNGFPVRAWAKQPNARNEALDCAVYAYAALQLLYRKYSQKTIWDQFRLAIDARASKGELESEKPTPRRSLNVLRR